MPIIRSLDATLDGSAVALGSAGRRTAVIESGAYETPFWLRDGGALVHRVDSLPWQGVTLGDELEVLSEDPTEPAGVEPLMVLDWDYANTSAMLADPLIEDSSGSSGAVSIETVSGMDFDRVVRSTFLEAGTYADHQIGVTRTIPNASVHHLREIWLEYLFRFGGPYEANGPISNGGPGEKHLFLFDQEETGAGRWEAFLNIGGDSLQATFGGGYSSEKGGSGGETVAYSPNMAAVYQNAGWNVFRAHGLMHASLGMWRFQINGQVCTWGNVGNTDRGAGYYFNKIAVQRNINRGVFRDQWRETGPISIFDTNPGWSWGS